MISLAFNQSQAVEQLPLPTALQTVRLISVQVTIPYSSMLQLAVQADGGVAAKLQPMELLTAIFKLEAEMISLSSMPLLPTEVVGGEVVVMQRP
ncbi:hypothetical protein PMIT1320_00595 [Prochlorococcus marinus str. MIT 1320]|nr:hypothetical protein PMIT1320_00595 [Prochlorococcus marinus str. MIT 1320]